MNNTNTKSMKTLTIGGTTYEIVDKQARENKVDKTHAEIIESLSMGRKIDTPVGTHSTALGSNVEAISESSIAEGINAQAGSKAFTVVGINVEQDHGPDTTSCWELNYDNYKLDSTEGLAVGDVYSVHLYYTDGTSSQYENVGTIEGIDGNYVYVSSHPFTKEVAFKDSYLDENGIDTEQNTFRIIAKPNIGTRTIGYASHAEGGSTKALLKGAHSEGQFTKAYGSYSHAEGNGSVAGYCAHAEGFYTKATGFWSHAEGFRTDAFGQYAHAEGLSDRLPEIITKYSSDEDILEAWKNSKFSLAKGDASHVQGYNNLALGNRSSAKGYFTRATAEDSNSEGQGTLASGQASNAKGSNSIASGNYSHAEGMKSDGNISTVASGMGSHAEGRGTKASGKGAHAEGYETLAEGISSHAEGWNTKALGEHSHAEGGATTASAMYSHSEGTSSKAIGYGSHAEGNSTEASGGHSHTEGGYTKATDSAAHAEGYYTEARKFAHAEGNSTKALADQSHAEGHKSSATGENAHAEGYQTIAKGFSSHAEGNSLRQVGSNIVNGTDSNIKANWDNSKFALAKGVASHTEGTNCMVLGDRGHAEGNQSLVHANNGHAEGYYAQAYGHCSHAEGHSTHAGIPSEPNGQNYGFAAHAEGRDTRATGNYSHAEGRTTEATNGSAHAEGEQTHATGYQSHAEGMKTTAKGDHSHSEGLGTVASGTNQHTQGRYNIVDEDYQNATYAHIIGNGTDDTNRSNAHTLDWQGNAWYLGSVTSNGADYAEFFEWVDGNTDNEDRVGLLVTLDGEKIKVANSGDEILGIISATAAVLGDNYECDWNGKYLTDDFGRILYDEVEEFVEVPKTIISEIENEETGEVEFTETTETETHSLGFFKHPRINPDYNPEQAYVNRANRAEWDTVGMVGKLYLRDDGTCKVNKYATVGVDGIATASDERTNIRVLTRVNENVVRVLLK